MLRFPERSRTDSFGRGTATPPPLWIHGYRGKRTFDIVAGGLVALALLPIGVLVGLALLASRGRVFERTVAIGRDGQHFRRLRFRTRGSLGSSDSSDSSGEEGDGPGQILPLFEAEEVPRTRIGRFLHATGLERLPELWNVLRGDLTLVGPSAQILDETEETPTFPPRWEIKPGFLWVAPSAAEQESVIRYVASQGIWTDLKILTGATWRILTRALTT